MRKLTHNLGVSERMQNSGSQESKGGEGRGRNALRRPQGRRRTQAERCSRWNAEEEGVYRTLGDACVGAT